MELLNNQERELLAKYNQLLPTTKNQEPIKYSDVFIGKHDMETVPTLSKEKKIQNTKLSVKNTSASKKDQFKNIISELNNVYCSAIKVQARQIDNVFKNGALFDENSKQKSQQQLKDDSKVTVQNENISQQLQSMSKFSDRPEKQPRQQSAKEIPEKFTKVEKKSKKDVKQAGVEKGSNANEIQQLFNQKLFQQVDRLVQMKKIDDNFFYNLVRNHIDECPQFGKRLKEEIKVVLNQLQ